MHSTILRAAALILFSSAVMVQPTDIKSPRSEFTDGQDARLRAFCSGIWQTLCMTECSRFLAHDPSKCERFGEKIMRSFKRLERDLGTNEGVCPGKTGFHFCGSRSIERKHFMTCSVGHKRG